jgi:putative membrane protein
VVNAAMIGLVSWLLPGMAIHGLFNACAAAIITGVASWIGHMALRSDRSYR